ncbi:MAG: hypothetical protein ACR2ND_08280, partial [Solirubrobacteraceae bacterium]
MSSAAEDLAILDRVLAGDPADVQLAAIVAAAREDRLEPRPEFRRGLDARVAGRFRRRRPSSRVLLGGGAAAASAVAAGVAVVVVLAGSSPRRPPIETLAPQPSTTAIAKPTAPRGAA